MNNEYYITSPHPLEGEQHGMHQPQRYGGGNRGGNYGGQAQGGRSMPRQQHPHQSQQQGQPQQQQQQGQPVVRAHVPQQMQQQSFPLNMGYQIVYTPQINQGHPLFRYPTAAPIYNPQYSHTQQIQFQQHVYQQQQAALYSAAAANVAGGMAYYSAAQVPAPQNPLQQHHNPTSYYSQQVQPIPQQFMPRAPVQTGVPQVPPPTQTHQTNPLHQAPPHVLQSNVPVGIPPGPQSNEHREPPPPPRKKKILQIVDPNTGKTVIDDNDAAPPSVSPLPMVESIGGLPEEVVTVSVEVEDEIENPISYTIGLPNVPLGMKNQILEEIDPGKNKAKADFFQLITAAADDGRGRSNSTPDAVPQHPQTVTTPIPTSSPNPFAPAFEPLGAPVPAVIHSPIPQVEETVELPVSEVYSIVSDPVIISLPLEFSQTIQQELSHEIVGTNGIVHPPVSNNGTITVTVDTEMYTDDGLPGTPPHTTGDRVDELLDISTVSVSPEPIEKYIEISPEKPSIPPSIESADPSLVGDSTRESTVSPSFPNKLEQESLPSSTPNHLSDYEEEMKEEIKVSENGNKEDEDVNSITKSIEEIKLTSIKPAQNEETFINGGDELEEGSMDEDEILEEGELPDDGDGETDESDQPTKKGRIRYDRDTLMNFKTGASKDAIQGIDLIPPELVRGENAPQNHGILPRGGVNVGFTSYGNRNTPMNKMGNNNRQGGFGNRQMQMSQQWGGIGAGGIFQIPPPAPSRNPPPVTLQLNPVKLHTTENAWKPSLPTKRGNKIVDDTQDEEQLLVQDIVKNTRGILNKLTPENFDKLLEKFLSLKLENKDERIGAVISVVFEKAIDEPSFSAAYAKMVCRVYEKSQEGSKIFRKKILDQCQKEFQQGNTDEEALKVLATKLAEAADDAKDGIKAEMEEKKVIARRRSLGNIRFIGELYKLQMLTPKIMVECVNMLLSARDEESLECLCKLLTTVGQKLDHQLSDIKGGKWMPEPKFMENTFAKLKQLSSDIALSSRIRFALLDVCELRDSGWKPRRDANAPKTIEEVRRAAIREEQEEKKQILNLPPVQPTRGPMPPLQKQKGDWNVVSSNKSSRFAAQTKRQGASDSSGDLPKFAPAGGVWARGGGLPTKNNLPPRFSRLNDLTEGPAPTPSREDIVQELPDRTPSSQSSRESSRPQTPTRDQGLISQRSQIPPPVQHESPPKEVKKFDVKETVKQIFNEYLEVKKFDFDWLQSRFPGKRVEEFVDELSRQVCEMTKEEHQKTAGGVIKNLIKKELITKAQVIKSLADGAITEMPDIEVDVPKVTSYLGMFLCELFMDEDELSWLLQLGESIEEDCLECWTKLVAQTLNILKLRRTEDIVQGIYKNTQGANRLPIQDIPWIAGVSLESLTLKMKTVLEAVANTEESTMSIFQENSWDLRDEVVVKGLMEAILTLGWIEKDQKYNDELLDRYFKQLTITVKLYPCLWQQCKDFMKRNGVDSHQEGVLWDLLMKHNLSSKDHKKGT